MSLAWDPNNLDDNKRALEAAMADEELMREISYLERDLEQKQREIRAEAFAREHAKDIPDYEELKTCYLKTLEELEGSCGGAHAETSEPLDMLRAVGDGNQSQTQQARVCTVSNQSDPREKRGESHARGSLRIIIFWSILGAGIAALAEYMIARLVG